MRIRLSCSMVLLNATLGSSLADHVTWPVDEATHQLPRLGSDRFTIDGQLVTPTWLGGPIHGVAFADQYARQDLGFGLTLGTGLADITLPDTSLGSDASWRSESTPVGARGPIGLYPMRTTVRAMTVFCGELVVAGDFGFMDGVPAAHVASWNGSRWKAVGGGLPFHDGVHCLAVYKNRLIAAGSGWPTDSTSCIAQWDGASWQSLRDGIDPGDYAFVYALEVHNDELIVAGRFTTAGKTRVNGIARWDGSTWKGLGNDSLFAGGAGVALAVHADQLYAGFNFLTEDTLVARVARWDGRSWVFQGDPMDAQVRALASHRGSLIAAGGFSHIGKTPSRSVASWDGSSWNPLGAGLDRGTGTAFVRDLLVLGDRLIAGGDFDRAGAISALGVASWNGVDWDSVGSRIGSHASVQSITKYAERLVACGTFFGPYGQNVGGLAAWDGSRWGPIAHWETMLVETPLAFLPTDSGLLAAGPFSVPGEFTVQDAVARWDGIRWKILGTLSGVAGSLALYRGNLVVAGSFDAIDGVVALNIAQFDGASWSSLGEGTDRVIADLAVYGDRLIAAGVFQFAGGQRLNRIAQWDGTSWSALGAGVWGLPPVLTIEPHIRDLEIYDGHLIACGHFTRADNVEVPGIARWNGSAWSSAGGEFTFEDADPWVFHLTTWNGRLVASGDFESVDGRSAENIALWDGASWQPLPFLHGNVSALNAHNGRLVVGGGFYADRKYEPSCIFQWDGEHWYRMGNGVWSGSPFVQLYPGVTAMATWRGALYVGGYFEVAGDKPAHRIARWDGQEFRLPEPVISFATAPNPARDELRAHFYLADPGAVRAVLFDAFGRRVAILAEGWLPGGPREQRWSLYSDDGRRLPSGIYFLRLDTERGSSTRKLTVIH